MGLIRFIRDLLEPVPMRVTIPGEPYRVPSSTAEPRDWTEHWAQIVTQDRERTHAQCRLPFSPCLQFIEDYQARNWQSVLVLGCGISTEPAMLAAAGYDVLATDVSCVAIEYMRSHPPSDVEIAQWHRMNGPPKGPERVGTCRYEVRDLVDSEPAQAFDLVYMPWVWQCLTVEAQQTCLQHLSRWVRPGGACLVTFQNIGGDSIDELHRNFTGADFIDPYETSRRWNSEGRSYETYQKMSAAEDVDAMRRLAAGEKLVRIYVVMG